MKHKLFLKSYVQNNFLLIAGLLISSSIFAYTPNSTDAVDAVDYAYLQDKYNATTLNPAVNTDILLKESRVTGYETADLSMVDGMVREVVFVGSSTIDYWSSSPEDLVADMKDTGTNTEMSLVNRGMGGSILAQQIYYFDRLVVPHAPKVVAFYCANDVDNETTEYVWELIRYYEYKIHTAWPNTVFCIASVNP